MSSTGFNILTKIESTRTDNDFDLGFADTLCGAVEPVSTYVDAFDAFKEERGRWAVSVIAGIGPGDCSSSLGNAAEATRLVEFAALTGDNAITSSICDGDLSQGLADALATFEAACNNFPIID